MKYQVSQCLTVERSGSASCARAFVNVAVGNRAVVCFVQWPSDTAERVLFWVAYRAHVRSNALPRGGIFHTIGTCAIVVLCVCVCWHRF